MLVYIYIYIYNQKIYSHEAARFVMTAWFLKVLFIYSYIELKFVHVTIYTFKNLSVSFYLSVCLSVSVSVSLSIYIYIPNTHKYLISYIFILLKG